GLHLYGDNVDDGPGFFVFELRVGEAFRGSPIAEFLMLNASGMRVQVADMELDVLKVRLLDIRCLLQVRSLWQVQFLLQVRRLFVLHATSVKRGSDNLGRCSRRVGFWPTAFAWGPPKPHPSVRLQHFRGGAAVRLRYCVQ